MGDLSVVDPPKPGGSRTRVIITLNRRECVYTVSTPYRATLLTAILYYITRVLEIV